MRGAGRLEVVHKDCRFLYNNSLLAGRKTLCVDSKTKNVSVEGGDHPAGITSIDEVAITYRQQVMSWDLLLWCNWRSMASPNTNLLQSQDCYQLLSSVQNAIHRARLRNSWWIAVYEKKQNDSYGAISGRHDDKVSDVLQSIFSHEMDMPTIVERKERGYIIIVVHTAVNLEFLFIDLWIIFIPIEPLPYQPYPD